MKAGILVLTAIIVVLLALPAITMAAPDTPVMMTMMDSQIYGNRMMTDYERAQYKAKMRNARSSAEKVRLQQEHQKLMQERAKQRGHKLRAAPPAQNQPKFKTKKPVQRRSLFDRDDKRSKFKRKSDDRRRPFDRSRRR